MQRWVISAGFAARRKSCFRGESIQRIRVRTRCASERREITWRSADCSARKWREENAEFFGPFAGALGQSHLNFHLGGWSYSC